MKPFNWVIVAQACVFCGGVAGMATAREAYEPLGQSPTAGEVGLGLFLVTCILLRLLMERYWWGYTALVLCLFTASLTLMGGQVAAWLVVSDDPSRGQCAVYLGCITLLC